MGAGVSSDAMNTREITLPVSQFEARCLELVAEVGAGDTEVTITQDDRPVARLVATARKHLSPLEAFHSMAGGVTILGDIEAPLDVEWEVDR